MVSFRTFRHSLLPKPVGTFFCLFLQQDSSSNIKDNLKILQNKYYCHPKLESELSCFNSLKELSFHKVCNKILRSVKIYTTLLANMSLDLAQICRGGPGKQTWPAVYVVRVIEQCCFNSTPDPFNGQRANSILKPLKLIESRSYVKKGDLECYWNNTVLLHWQHVQLVKSAGKLVILNWFYPVTSKSLLSLC